MKTLPIKTLLFCCFVVCCSYAAKAQLSGSYTVDAAGSGSTNFTSIADAVNALYKSGVSGPVVFNLKSGTYAYNLKLDQVSGVTASSTVTFKGVHADSVRIYATSSAPTLYMNGADYFRFENISLEHRDSAGIVVHMLNGADNNQFTSCKIINTSSYFTWNSFALILADDPKNFWTSSDPGTSASYNIFRNNLIKGGYYNVAMSGKSSGSQYNQFYDNRVIGATGRGFIINYQDSLHLIGNTIDSVGNGALLLHKVQNFVVEQNKMIGGIFLNLGNDTAWNSLDQSSISNNEIVSGNSTHCIFMLKSSHIDLHHNSCSSLSQNACVALSYNSDIDFRNNILYQKSGRLVIEIEVTSFLAFDYNNYTHNAQNLAQVDRNTYADLAALKSDTIAHNQNSQDKEPDWINASTNLKPGSGFPNLFAPNVGALVDIDNNSRCKHFTALGAYEVVTTRTAKADFTAPDTVRLGSQTNLQNKLGASTRYNSTWIVNGKVISDSLHLVYKPVKTGLDTITLVVNGCSTPDTMTKYVFVDSLISKPAVNFSVSNRNLDTNELFRLYDLSTNAPTEWSWDISPKFAFDVFLGVTTNTFKFDSTQQNPTGRFFIAGDYTVKLKATNAIGANSRTKTFFIRVREPVKMCGIQSESNGAFGTLFDDGGSRGNYSRGLNGNNKCVYRISGCHGPLEFDVKAFDLASGDYLQLYDGKDTDGKPLWDQVNYPKGMTGAINDPSIPNSILAVSGSAYIVFESRDSSLTRDGFAIDWTAKSGGVLPPTAALSVPDTVCEGSPFVLENVSTGGWDYVEWDLDGNGTYDNVGDKLVHTVTAAQNLKITLKANSTCGPSDSISKTIVVEKASRKATPNFTTSDTLAVAGKTVILKGAANYCVSAFRWEISPANYSLPVDATLSQTTLRLAFTKSGKYTIKLVTENSFGKDSIVKTNYIRVIEYCQPIAANLNPDLGISRVQFNEIDNRSSTGDRGYWDYTHLSANVELGKSYAITIERTTTLNTMNRNVWVDWNRDGDFDDANELVATEATALSLVFTDSIKVPSDARKGNTVMRVSTNIGGRSNTACGLHESGEFEDYTISISQGTTTAPPTIVLTGNLVDTIDVYSTWTEPGYSAFDLENRDLTSKVVIANNLDNTITGTYTIEYKVTDRFGSSGNATRTVVVADRTLPTINLVGNDTLFVQVNELVADPALTYSDNYDKILILERKGTIDNTLLGFYPVEYCVTDAAGNGPVCVTVIVEVGDTIAPELSSASTITLPRWSAFNAATAATFDDNYYATTDLTVLVTGNTVNVNSTGDYSVIYDVSDPSGNQKTFTVFITVVETDETIGITEADAASVKLYPNPTNGMLHMEFQLPDMGQFQISVRNTLGQEVQTITQSEGGTFTETLYLQNLTASIYYVVVQGEGFKLVEKFVLTE